MTDCSTSIGHEGCGYSPTIVEHEGHKASPDAWERSKNKVYFRKVARQQNKFQLGPQMSFKKGKNK